jgi:peptidase E
MSEEFSFFKRGIEYNRFHSEPIIIPEYTSLLYLILKTKNIAFIIAFIPFASVDNNFEEYENKVGVALNDLPYKINIAISDNARYIIEKSDVIMVGRGNTFKLLHDICQLNLLEMIRNKINNGTPCKS